LSGERRKEENESTLMVVAESVFLVYLSKTAWSSSRLSVDYVLLENLLQEVKKQANLLLVPHELFERCGIKNTLTVHFEFLIQPINFRSSLEQLYKPPKIVKVQKSAMLRVCSLNNKDMNI
jgi:hypothetical protein